jgi:hypothetical protein
MALDSVVFRRVQVWDTNGKYLRQWGTFGSTGEDNIAWPQVSSTLLLFSWLM